MEAQKYNADELENSTMGDIHNEVIAKFHMRGHLIEQPELVAESVEMQSFETGFNPCFGGTPFQTSHPQQAGRRSMGKTRLHEVQQGEYLGGIAEKYAMSLDLLLWLNPQFNTPFRNMNLIYPCERIVVIEPPREPEGGG